MGRTIIYGADFDQCVAQLGGYRAIDVALETVIDGLRRNPFGFYKFESDVVSFRYAITESIGAMPPLQVIFVVNPDRTVSLEWIEEVQ